jgi:hypothetical protein
MSYNRLNVVPLVFYFYQRRSLDNKFCSLTISTYCIYVARLQQAAKFKLKTRKGGGAAIAVNTEHSGAARV